MPRGNDRCPCGSGLKFKRCCRNKGRDPETCHFCKRVESEEVRGRYADLVDDVGKEESKKLADIWACEDCIEKQKGSKGDVGVLPLMLLGLWGHGRKTRG